MADGAFGMVFSWQLWRMALLWTGSILFSRLLLVFSSSTRTWPRVTGATSGSGSGRICVVTGATSGLGKAAAIQLARQHYHLILAGRNPDLLIQTAQEIKELRLNCLVEPIQLDLSSYISIKNFQLSLKQRLSDLGFHHSIQLLVNNAGILANSFRETPDGFDEMMATNYIGAFVLTNLLMPLLKNSPVPSRVVNVTSFTHRCVFDLDVYEVLYARRKGQNYPLASTYEYSKLCLLLFSYELHRRLHLEPTCHVSVMAADPGVVKTNIMRELPLYISRFSLFVLRILCLLQPPEIGVNSIIDASLAPPESSGKYFFGGKCRTIESSSLSGDTKIAEKLWSASSAIFKEMESKANQTISS
ncbi:NAD(P)-binding Rossmann-fold superfamily protein [Rhynchospora pubera]|uniref:NAD(P)-binding Rossmann-fold superfamily protein n=1 Tax=Rhynchospora pubera TaxID=906938 RepID=A0AAV8G0S0_9POAL|nr:NAD(P)-binding Rossmann-fold superfamily protein [Rhynchospora pubera]